MIVPLDLIIFAVLILTAVLAINVKDLLAAVALLAAYSLFASLLFAGVNAVDVSLVEAALGAGLTGVLFIGAILATSRHSMARRNLRRRYTMLPLIGAFLALMVYASIDLPDRGDPEAPAHLGVSQTYLRDSLDDTQTPNVVTSLLADYRSQDTLGETLVIVTAALAATLVLIRRRDDEYQGHAPSRELPLPDGDEVVADPYADDVRSADRRRRPR